MASQWALPQNRSRYLGVPLTKTFLVFSSLLAQRQFTAAGFALDALNHPATTDNFLAVFSVEQSLFDRTTSANVRAASIGRDTAATVDAAQAASLAQVVAQAGWELNGGAWNSRSSSWVAGVVGRINLFHGLADKARLAAAREQVRRRALDKSKAETMARLDVQIAIARLEAARESEAVGRAAADWARESRRIIRDRYESGLTDVAMLLRSANAVQQADAQQIAARVNVLTATAALQRAIGKP